jgi:hypothetical protein
MLAERRTAVEIHMTEIRVAEHVTTRSQVEVTSYERTVMDPPDASGVAIVETRLHERFTGGLVGEGTATHVRLEQADGAGTLICYERIKGDLDGRSGAFLLEASGYMTPSGHVHGRWEIVHGSGTDELTGLRGFAAFGAHRDSSSATGWSADTTLTYWFED